MEVLRFPVNGQMIKKDPASPFKDMVAGSSNYYQAEFVMDDAWRGYACVAVFKAGTAVEYEPIVRGKCMIPEKILAYRTFTVSVMGKKLASILKTNEIKIVQLGGVR